jgi:hypothetical protein
MTDDGERVRSWQEIALEAWHERDPEKLRALTKELELALDERDKKRKPQPVFLKRQQTA